MASHSKLTNIVLLATAGACFATTIVLVYLLRRNQKEDIFEELEPIVTSRHVCIEVQIPNDIVGSVIGRAGSNIAKIQETTSTRVNFRDEAKGEDYRVALIRGKPGDAQAAERLIKKAIAERQSILKFEMQIPTEFCGYIIGKNGTTIREICDISKAKVQVDSTSCSGSATTPVIIKGTAEEIDYAKALIEEKIRQKQSSKKGNGLSTANRQMSYHNRHLAITGANLLESGPISKVEPLIPSGKDGFLQVMISSMESPSRFWVQPVGIKATELDKLVENMSDFYQESANVEEFKLNEVKVGDMVAAPFKFDESIYRARIVSISVDEYNADDSEVNIYYVDFGDYATFKRSELFSLREDFLQLLFQATECRISGITASGDTWSEEAVKSFGCLVFCAEWKWIMLKVVDNVRGSDDEVTMVVELVDTSGEKDVYVAKEMVQQGFARWSSSAANTPKEIGEIPIDETSKEDDN